jgi:osmotically inducible lipoprotein OsmB
MPAIYTRRSIVSFSVVSLALAAACGDANKGSQRDIELAPKGQEQAKLNDAPLKGGMKAPARAPAKAPTEAGGIKKLLGLGPKMGTIGAGNSFDVHPSVRVCTNTHKVGSTVAALVNAPLNGSNGAVIPAGSTIDLRVRESARSENSKDNVKLTFDVVSVQLAGATYPVDARVTQVSTLELVRAQSTATQAEKVGAGAAIGAIAGQVIGKNTRSTVAGAVVGAAAGTAVAMGTADYDGCLGEGGKIAITLNAPLKVLVGKQSP